MTRRSSKKAADDNLVTDLNNSAFTPKEKIAFFKKKWLKEHISAIVVSSFAWVATVVLLRLKPKESGDFAPLGAIGSILEILFIMCSITA